MYDKEIRIETIAYNKKSFVNNYDAAIIAINY